MSESIDLAAYSVEAIRTSDKTVLRQMLKNLRAAFPINTRSRRVELLNFLMQAYLMKGTIRNEVLVTGINDRIAMLNEETLDADEKEILTALKELAATSSASNQAGGKRKRREITRKRFTSRRRKTVRR